ncbi:unnamed protein product [Effrenium voratum]|nr:unnamed protein product [Effrenium voratum]
MADGSTVRPMPRLFAVMQLLPACRSQHDGRANGLREALQLLSDARSRRSFTPRLATAALARLAKHGQSQAAVQVLSWMQEQQLEVNAYHCSATLSACATTGEWQLALHLLTESAVSEVSYNSALDAVLKGGQWELALELFVSMRSWRLQPDAVSCSGALAACGALSRWQRGLAFVSGLIPDEVVFTGCMSLSSWGLALRYWHLLAEKTRPTRPNQISCNSAVKNIWPASGALLISMAEWRRHPDAWTRAALMSREWEASLQVLRTDGTRAGTDGTDRADEVVFNAAMDLLPWESSLQLMDHMSAARPKPGKVTLTAAALACATRWESVEMLLEMQRLQIRSDVFAFNTALSCERWQRALARLFRMPMVQQWPDEISYSACVSASEKSSQWRWATNILDRFHATKIAAKQIALNAALSACEKSLQWALAIKILCQMRHCRSADGVSVGASISACEKCSHWERSLALLNAESGAISYGAAISACEKGRQWQLALRLMSLMGQCQASTDQITYNAAMSACEKCSRWRPAVQLLGAMSFSDSGAFNAAIAACHKGQLALAPAASRYSFGAALTALRSGHWNLALGAWDRMQSLRLSPDESSCSGVLSACVQGSRWKFATRLLGDFEPPHLLFATVSLPGAFQASQAAAKRLKATREPQEAARLLESLRDEVEVNAVHFNIVISKSDWDLAVSLMQRMQQIFISPSEVTFGAVIRSCSRAQQWERALHTLDRMENAKLGNEIAYSAALKGLDWDRALALLGRMPQVSLQPDLVCVSAAMSACASAGQWLAAMKLFQDASDASDASPDLICLNTLISSLEQQGLWEQAVTTLRATSTPNMITYNAAISVCDKAGQWQLATYLMGEAASRRLSPGVVTYNSCISSCQQSSSWEMSLHLLDEMSTGRLAPDVISFTSVISVCAQAGLWQTATHVLHRMLHRSIPPNDVTYSALMVACAKSEQWQMSLVLLEDLRGESAANALPTSPTSLPRSVIVCNSALSALEKGRQWHLALRLLWRMQAARLADEISRNAAISACEKCGQWQAALQLLKSQASQNQVAFNAAISACEKGGQWQMALELLAAMPDAQLSPDSISVNAAISSCGPRWQTALALLHNMHSMEVQATVVSYNTAMSACEKSCCWEMVLCLLKSMESPNEISFTAALTATGKGQQWQLALDLFHSIASPDSVCYTAAICACATDGYLWRLTLDLLQSMKERGLLPSEVTYTAVISSLTQWKLALSLLEEMQQCKAVPNDITYSCVINACAKAQHWLCALDLLSSLTAANLIAYTGAIGACEATCQWQAALGVLQHMSETRVNPNLPSLCMAMEAVYTCGQLQSAVPLSSIISNQALEFWR